MSIVHSVFDSDALKRQAVMADAEEKRQKDVDYAQAILAQGRMLGPTAMNLDAQLGRTMTHQEFERRALKLHRSLWANDHPQDVMKRVLWLLKPDGSREYISAYE